MTPSGAVFFSLALTLLSTLVPGCYCSERNTNSFNHGIRKVQLQAINPMDYDSKNVSMSQWKFFTSALVPWNSYLVRFSKDGRVNGTSFLNRIYDHLYPNLVIQTNRYFTSSFALKSGLTNRTRKIYIHKLPLISGVYSLNGNQDDDDWTSTTEQATGSLQLKNFLLFYPPFFQSWGSASLKASYDVFSLEKFVRLPELQFNVRLSVRSEYKNGEFSHISTYREVAPPVKYGKKGYWTFIGRGFVLDENNKFETQNRRWVGTQYCLNKNFYFTMTTVNLEQLEFSQPSGNERIELQLPDGVEVSYPKSLDAFKNGTETTFAFRWITHPYQVILSVLTYDGTGRFSSDCTTILKSL